MLRTKIVLNVKSKQKQQFVYTTCSAGIMSLQFLWTMNNLSSYCWLVDAKIRAPDKDLPVINTHKINKKHCCFTCQSRIVQCWKVFFPVFVIGIFSYHDLSRNNLKLLALELEFAQPYLGSVFQLSRTWKQVLNNSYFEKLPIHQIIIPTKYW